MNSVDNFKSTQWRKLFKAFMSSGMQILNIFGGREGLLFEFTCFSRFWKFEKLFNGSGPHVSGPFPFDRLGRSLGPAHHPYFQWLCSPCTKRLAPVAAGRRRPHWLATP
jgi:hypothetical protein